MKKFAAFLLVWILTVCLAGCAATREHTVRIVIPAGSQAEFVYSDEVIMPHGQLTMKSIDVSDGTSVVLKAVETEKDDVPTFFLKGQPMIVNAEEGTWYRIGIAMQNPTDEDITVVINIENAKVRTA